jgi:protein-S-isoprenylcysteine O-methyltransferase Ste14
MNLDALELRIPPPAVALLVAVAMWGVSLAGTAGSGKEIIRIALAAALAVTGVGCSASGVMAFRRAQTTSNPMKPETSTVLVRAGVYARTRNPMYLGLLLVLLGWAVFLRSPWVLPGPLAYILYITRFQILPEEWTLRSLFGADYDVYRSQVRRWL